MESIFSPTPPPTRGQGSPMHNRAARGGIIITTTNHHDHCSSSFSTFSSLSFSTPLLLFLLRPLLPTSFSSFRITIVTIDSHGRGGVPAHGILIFMGRAEFRCAIPPASRRGRRKGRRGSTHEPTTSVALGAPSSWAVQSVAASKHCSLHIRGSFEGGSGASADGTGGKRRAHFSVLRESGGPR